MSTTYPGTIPFRTGRAAEGPLIWGQLAIWNVLRWLPPDDTTLNLLVEVPVPPGRDLPAVLDALRTLVERHDSLHTVYLDGPLQRVLPQGEVPLEVHELGDRGSAEAAAELGEALRVRWFDMAADLPLRVAVLVRDGAPQTVLLAASHMAVDGWSFAIVRGDLANLLADPPVVVEPGQQPLERGEYERSAVGRRRAAKALAFWEKHLAEIPASMIESIRDGRPPNLDWGLIQSPALALATNDLAARHGVPPATALQGLTALQLAAYTAERETFLRSIVSTRFRPASRGVVAAFNQNALFRLDCDPAGYRDETVGGLLRRSADAALTAYAHCEYDPLDLDAMFVAVAERRGITPDGYCFFNDTRFVLDRSPGHLVPPAELAERIQAALPATKLRSPVIDRRPMHANFFMFLMDLGDTAELMLCVEHGFLGRRGPLGFLTDLERLAVRAATDDQVTTAALYTAAR
ncbi:condensation domain-containing protein [Dactylosporangium sp. NPDC005572]|uniref:condensation domain-containing protein n=1 Tax=Dactylosporangium sp. NPDC005572 TaxID=3156889 RepID=UPI0033A4F7CF